jgi:hypothetical protein
MGLLVLKALITSGMILSLAQSPPPITLPARAVTIAFLCEMDSLAGKNEFLKEFTTSSVHALLALYGS